MDNSDDFYSDIRDEYITMCTKIFNKGQNYRSIYKIDLDLKLIKPSAIKTFHKYICNPKNFEIIDNNPNIIDLIKFFSEFTNKNTLYVLFMLYLRARNI